MSASGKISTLGVVILGAGASSRMGRPKLLLPWRDTTVIGAILRQWCELGAGQIAVVHRPNDEKLVEEIKRAEGRTGSPLPAVAQTNDSAHGVTRPTNVSTHFIVNPKPELGMFSSIVCAANWPGWKTEISNWVIALGDQPHLNSDTLRQFLVFHSAHAGAICQPEFDGHMRHPVILQRAAFAELKSTTAATLKDFLKQIPVPRVQCAVTDAGLALDMDTPDDYKRLTVSN